MSTLRDVARLAGVSTTTVSAVVNQKGKVSEKLEKRVVRAVEALDYHPDQAARGLKVRRTNIIGLIHPDITNAFFTDVMQGVEDEARRSRYSVISCNANKDRELERHYLNVLFSHRVDGVILASIDPHASLDCLTRRRIPVVCVDRIPQGFSGAAVVTDNFDASRMAGRLLIELGHRRIAIITGPLDISNSLSRLEGFRKGLQEAGLLLADQYSPCGYYRAEPAYQCALQLMQLPHPPTAILSCNNKMTLGLMRALGELRIPCPERVSVVGFDDSEWAADSSPRLTTIAQPSYEMGRRATELLVSMLKHDKQEGEQGENGVIVLPSHLVIRDSTAPHCGAVAPQSAA